MTFSTVPLNSSPALGRSVVIDDAGHATNVDRPDEFNGVLLAFVAGLLGAGAFDLHHLPRPARHES